MRLEMIQIILYNKVCVGHIRFQVLESSTHDSYAFLGRNNLPREYGEFRDTKLYRGGPAYSSNSPCRDFPSFRRFSCDFRTFLSGLRESLISQRTFGAPHCENAHWTTITGTGEWLTQYL